MHAGFIPVAHIEIDQAACYTLKTRLAYKWLKNNNNEETYRSYLKGEISRDTFYEKVPEEILQKQY